MTEAVQTDVQAESVANVRNRVDRPQPQRRDDGERIMIGGRHVPFDLPKAVPASLSRGAFAPAKNGLENFPLIIEVRSALDAAREPAVKALQIATAIHGDVTRPIPARHIAVANATGPLLSRASKALQKTSDALAERIAVLEKQTVPKKPDQLQVAMTGAMVTALLTMGAQGRRKVIEDGIKTHDERITPLLFSLPAFASGLTDDEQRLFCIRWRHEVYPDDMELLAELRRTGEWVERGQRLIDKFATQLYAPVVVRHAEGARQAAMRRLPILDIFELAKFTTKAKH